MAASRLGVVSFETARDSGALEPEEILRLEADAVILLDQRELPARTVHRRCGSWDEVASAIRDMTVRGAPAIGIAGAMGVALAARARAESGPAAQRAEVEAAAAALRVARPTAVNLASAVDAQAARAEACDGPPDERARLLEDAARALHAAEVRRCRAMGEHGAALLRRGAQVLTHCNAGGLATGGYGTALGVVRSAHAAGQGIACLVDETRPLLQGARLTAWELERAGIPHTVIADNMAASLMAAGRVTDVIVGADRIAANGDVVNKIGTYALAVCAREHDIPFYVAAPTTTLDLSRPDGADIPVEERAADEMRSVSVLGRSGMAADAPVLNPAFDRTPARLVRAIITEAGVHRPPYERSLAAALSESGGI